MQIDRQRASLSSRKERGQAVCTRGQINHWSAQKRAKNGRPEDHEESFFLFQSTLQSTFCPATTIITGV